MDRRTFVGSVGTIGLVGLAGCNASEEQSVPGLQTFRPFSWDPPILHIFLVDEEQTGPPTIGGALDGVDVSHIVVTRTDIEDPVATFKVDYEKDTFIANLDPRYAPYDEIDGTYYVHSVAGGTDPVEYRAETVPVDIEFEEMRMQSTQGVRTESGESPYTDKPS